MSQLTPERIALGLMSYVVLLFSLSVHESAHGWMASRMGDDTAKSQGRVTLNPIVHIDPMGTILMPLLQLISSGIPLLAWAKPTPVTATNFRRLGRGHVLVAGAGPVSNALLALLFTAVLFAVRRAGVSGDGPLVPMLALGIQLNVALGIFNLIPVPPLDGSWVVSWGLPRPIAQAYDRIVEPMGQWLLLVLLFPISWVLGPATRLITLALYRLVV